MEISALLLAYLLAMEPKSIDRPEVFDRIKVGRAFTPNFSSATIRAQQAGPDVAANLLACYHPSAKLQSFNVLGNWRPAWELGADHSLVFRLDYAGLSGSRYSMDTAIASKPDGQVRAIVIADNAMIAANKNAPLRRGVHPRPTHKSAAIQQKS